VIRFEQNFIDRPFVPTGSEELWQL